MDPGEAGGAGDEPVEGLRAEPPAEDDLDVLDGAVGQALDREVDDPRSGRGGPDPLLDTE